MSRIHSIVIRDSTFPGRDSLMVREEGFPEITAYSFRSKTDKSNTLIFISKQDAYRLANYILQKTSAMGDRK